MAKTIFFGVSVAAVLMLASCAAGPTVMATRPGPDRPSEIPGNFGTTIAVYDPALYGPERPLSEIVTQRRLSLDKGKLRNAKVLINKAQRRLELWVGRRMVKAYRIQLGWRALGPKKQLGDRKTPEGVYFICNHRPATYHMSLWLAYPNPEDARRGLESGLISRETYQSILDKFAARACPPQDTRLGGEILIHGQLPELTAALARKHRADPAALRAGWRPGDADPAAMREYQDWTEGCVAMFNPDIRELYEFLADGTEVIIVANAMITRPAGNR